MKLFIISSRYPYPLEKGDKLRLFNQIQQLSKHFEIILVSLTDQTVSELGMSRLRPYCHSIHVFKLTRKTIIMNVIKGCFKSLPAQISYFLNQKIKTNILDLIKTEAPDHIYAQLIRTSEYIKDLDIPKTLDYMDSFSLSTYKRSLNSSFLTKWFWKLESNLLKKYESRIYPYFDQHTAISATDASWIKENQDLNITLISNGLDYRFFKDVDASRDIDILFLGNLSYFSNINAVQYLINEIMPLLNKKNKNLNVVIAGAQPQRNLIRLIRKHAPSISLMANIIDTKAVYKRAKIFVAPITLGTGQQNKVLEAIASGCEVVCSDDVSEGLPGLHEYISLAKSPEEYAALIFKKWTDYEKNKPQRNLAKEFVKENFSWEKNTAPLVELLKKSKVSSSGSSL